MGSCVRTGNPVADKTSNCSPGGNFKIINNPDFNLYLFYKNGEFHQTIQELLQWLDTTTATIKEAEPVDLTVSKSVLTTKYNKFLELQKDLQRCEPRVVSLQEAADQLELQADSPACKQVKKKLAILSRSLRGLIQVCGIYLTNLARTLGLPLPPQVPDGSFYDSAQDINATVLPKLTDQVFLFFFRNLIMFLTKLFL